MRVVKPEFRAAAPILVLVAVHTGLMCGVRLLPRTKASVSPSTEDASCRLPQGASPKADVLDILRQATVDDKVFEMELARTLVAVKQPTNQQRPSLFIAVLGKPSPRFFWQVRMLAAITASSNRIRPPYLGNHEMTAVLAVESGTNTEVKAGLSSEYLRHLKIVSLSNVPKEVRCIVVDDKGKLIVSEKLLGTTTVSDVLVQYEEKKSNHD